MRLRVNPNRMEFSRLRRKLALASRGYKLLKEKQDGMIQEFFRVVRLSRELRTEVEKELNEYYASYIDAVIIMPRESLNEALMFPGQKAELRVSLRNRMGVRTPAFDLEMMGEAESYGFLGTSGQLDRAVGILKRMLPKMMELASLEKQVELMAFEIERTRRRVNTLEYVMIPNLKETIKYISMKLGENERSTATRLLRIKDIVRK